MTAVQVTKALRVHAGLLEHSTSINPKDISACSLRVSRAMALLIGKYDASTIKLLARWHSDSMMRYLHAQSLPVFEQLAAKMFNYGVSTFLPLDWIPAA